MSLFGANSAQPVQGIPSTPHTSRSHPDRKRREKQEKKEEEHSHREEDHAELSAQQEGTDPQAPAAHAAPVDPEEHPHIDVQG